MLMSGGWRHSSSPPPGGHQYSLHHTVRNMDVLHGDELSQFIQAVHILDLIQELHTVEDIKIVIISIFLR